MQIKKLNVCVWIGPRPKYAKTHVGFFLIIFFGVRNTGNTPCNGPRYNFRCLLDAQKARAEQSLSGIKTTFSIRFRCSEGQKHSHPLYQVRTDYLKTSCSRTKRIRKDQSPPPRIVEITFYANANLSLFYLAYPSVRCLCFVEADSPGDALQAEHKPRGRNLSDIFTLLQKDISII